jgi:hypothetical protein
MSKRITTKTDMKDKAFAIQALKNAGLAYEEMGNTTLRITSGALAHATIDLTTGNITGDSDFGHRSEVLGSVRKHYSEVKFRHEAAREGVQIKSRQEHKDGSIRLVCRMVASA